MDYAPLDAGSLPRRLGALPALAGRLGPASAWRVREVGDGNLNLVFVVEGPDGAAIVKQAYLWLSNRRKKRSSRMSMLDGWIIDAS